ncbi:MAG: trypsin-like peptidase domain-containing protein [Lachnospiraceae bacterium]|nr:trypsin-like peptidase domain-containing protein [Lachnospiraceae bacterium]
MDENMNENLNGNLNEDINAGAGEPENLQDPLAGGDKTAGPEGFQYSDSGNRFYQDDAYYHTEGSSYTGSGEEPKASASAQTGGSYRSDDSRYYQAGSEGTSYRSSSSYHSASPSGPSPSDGGRKGGKVRAVLAIILALAIGAGAGAGAMSVSGLMSRIGSRQAQTQTEEEVQDGAEENTQESSGDQKARYSLTVSQSDSVVTGVTEVAANVMPSIVSVYNNYTSAVEFFGQTYSQEGVSTGSGIIVAETDTELLIVTNNHVVKDADSLSVQFINEETADAAIKGTDASNDLAVIAVKTEDMSQETKDAIAIATLGDSEALTIGEPAIAIGNALGYGQSVTVGYISALNRQIEMDDNYTNTFIQTDAAINPGNSGGARVNIKGEVIGINSNKIGGDTVEGMGFAIPVSRALPIIEDLMNQTTKYTVAEEKQGTLGISGRDVTSDIASAYGMPQGVYIAKFVEGGAAEKTDLHVGDIITAIGGSSVSSMMELKKQLTYYEAGSSVTVTVSRQNEKGEYESMDIDVTLGTRASIESGSGQENRNPFGGRNN